MKKWPEEKLDRLKYRVYKYFWNAQQILNEQQKLYDCSNYFQVVIEVCCLLNEYLCVSDNENILSLFHEVESSEFYCENFSIWRSSKYVEIGHKDVCIRAEEILEIHWGEKKEKKKVRLHGSVTFSLQLKVYFLYEWVRWIITGKFLNELTIFLFARWRKRVCERGQIVNRVEVFFCGFRRFSKKSLLLPLQFCKK